MDYPVTFERDHEGNVIVRFPDFPHAQTVAPYEENAVARARTTLITALAGYIRASRAIPTPSSCPGLMRVPVSLQTTAKLALYEAMRKSEISRSELARRLRWHRAQVDRLLDVRHASRLDQMEIALHALRYQLTITVAPIEAAADNSALKRSAKSLRAPGRRRANT